LAFFCFDVNEIAVTVQLGSHFKNSNGSKDARS
jgi:hypothetical protein